MRILKLAALAATIIVAAAGSAMAHPLVTFATFQSIGDAPTIQWEQNPGQPSGAFVSTGATTANATIHFLPGPYLQDYPLGDALSNLSVLGDIPAILTITGAGSYMNDPSYMRVQTVISFIYAGTDPFVINGVTYNAGANLLTAIHGRLAPATGLLETVAYTSDFANLGGFQNCFQGGALTLADEPNYHGDRYWPSVDSYSTQVSGYFTAGVPEPATWAMMIIGFGMVGAMTRSRRLAA